MDREAKDPFDLLDELEEELIINVRPLTWPIESGPRFKGVYNLYEHKLNLFQPSKQVVTEKVEVDINTEELTTRSVLLWLKNCAENWNWLTVFILNSMWRST